MPISITHGADQSYKKIITLCPDDWELPRQLGELELWLSNNPMQLKSGSYIADVGFDIRPNAFGGGAVITVEMLGAMSQLGMELHLSEYPGTITSSHAESPL